MKNEKGITLVELLASVTILFIISSVLYGVLLGRNKDYNRIASNANLEQEANLIFTTVKYYHQSESSYKLAYDSETKTAYIGKDQANTVLGNPNDIDAMMINGVDLKNSPNPIAINTTDFITVIIVLKNHSVVIDTVINRY